MTTFRPLLLVLAAAIAACTTPLPAGPGGASPTPRVARAGATPRPSGAPSADVPAAPAARAVLQRPAGAVRLLAGQVAIDARYAVSAGAGRIVSNNGAMVLAVGGFGLGAGAGNLISDHGAGLVTDNGAGLLANNGAAVVANNGARFRLAQAGPLPPLGTMALAAGMAIRVRDLATDTDLALGADAAGRPVKEVLTDADGRYSLYLPAGGSPNLLVRAQVPGNADPRFALALLSPESVADDRLDEDSSITTRLFRDVIQRAIASRLAFAVDAPFPLPRHLTFAELQVYTGSVQRLIAASNAAGLPQRDEATRNAVAQRIADVVHARFDVRRVPVASTLGDDEAFSAAQKVVGATRIAVTRKMLALEAEGADIPAHFAAQPYIARLEAGRAAPTEIRRPSDYVDVVVRGLGDDKRTAQDFLATFAELIGHVGLPDTELQRLQDLFLCLQIGIDRAVFLDEARVLDDVERTIRGS